MMGVLEDFEYIPTEQEFPNNSFLFIYTDGVTEANDKDDNRFGNERLNEIIEKNTKTPLKIFQELPDTIIQFANGKEQFDDITFIMVVRGDELINS
jgi:sigma-B regulation protein RsbU (phosphoserine phosphatase)